MGDVLKKALTILGDIKIFKYPLFLVYDPGSYQIKGSDLRNILDLIKPGDIFLRGYTNYLDGYFIPGSFSHAAVYYGGNDMAHSMAEGVFKEDILTFTRCDFITILRFNHITQSDIRIFQENCDKLIGHEYDFEFKSGDDKYYCSEFVTKVFEHKQEELNVFPEELSYLGGLVKKTAILPDAFLFSEGLHPVFSSELAIEKIKKEMYKKCKK